MVAKMCAGERKEDVVDECDWRGRPLDVEDDGAGASGFRRKGANGLRQRQAPAADWIPGMYAGPKQTG